MQSFVRLNEILACTDVDGDVAMSALARRARKLGRIVRKERERRLVRALARREAAAAVASCAQRLRSLRDELLGRALDAEIDREAIVTIAAIRFAAPEGDVHRHARTLRDSAEHLRHATHAIAAYLSASLAMRGLVLDVDEHVLDLEMALAALTSAEHALAHPRPRAARAMALLEQIVDVLERRATVLARAA
jgi:hypothetical protein